MPKINEPTYSCEFCNDCQNKSYETVLQHEAQKHFNLKVSDYKLWQQLANSVNEWNNRINCTKTHMMVPTGPLQMERDIALDRLHDFETKHNLTGKTCPFLTTEI